MKKLLIATMMSLVMGSAVAVDTEFSVGRASTLKTDVTRVSVGTDVFAMKMAGEFETARNVYHAYGLTAYKDFPVFGNLSLGGKVGVSYVDSVAGKDGWVGRYGIRTSYALSKNVAVVADMTRSFSVQDMQQFKGNTYTAGVRFAF